MKVGAALLAAGGSSRFGRPKALVELGGVSLVRRMATELAAVASPVLVVAPPKAGAIALELSGIAGARVVVNRRPARGMGSSISCAARALAHFAPEAEALLVALVDQPLVSRELLAQLVVAGSSSSAGLRTAACDYGEGVVGPPAFFPGSSFPALSALDGDRGAREVLAASGAALALVPFPGGRVDLDTPADYERLLALDGAPGGASRLT